MSNVQQFIDLVGQGQNAQAQEALNDILSAKAFEALEAHKQQVGANLFATEKSVQVDEETKQIEEATSEYHPHGFTSDSEKKKHADKMKKEYNVRTTWHDNKAGGSEALRYHGSAKDVSGASDHISGNDRPNW